MVIISTNFYLKPKGSKEQGLHICKRSGIGGGKFRWRYQALYPSARYIQTLGKDPEVYPVVEDYKDILPEGVVAINSYADWFSIFEEMSDDHLGIYDEYGELQDLGEFTYDIAINDPEPLDEYCAKMEKELESWQEKGMNVDVWHSVRSDEFVDKTGHLLTYRSFS